MRGLFLLLLFVVGLAVVGLSHCPTSAAEPAVGPTDAPATGHLRNIILLIGDGMGPQQIGLLTTYAHDAPQSVVPDRRSAIEQVAEAGTLSLVRTEPHGALVVDSAAAATHLATGQLAGSEMIGTNFRGDPARTIVEVAHELGKSAGLVSDTRITHATPAAFAAHQRHRTMENEIAVDMLENQVEVMMSGGLRNWIPQAVNEKTSPAYAALAQMVGGRFEFSSKRQDDRNLLLEARRGYHLVFDRRSLDEVNTGRVLGLFANSEMDDAMAERSKLDREDRLQPTLVEMTTKALELLDQNPEGFFLMVEGGQIDWAGHNNDTGTMLQELLRFDAAVRTVFEWTRDRDDTLVLVTADHETGSFGFSYSGSSMPRPQTLDGEVFGGQMHDPNFNFASPDVLDQLYAQQRSFFDLFKEFDGLPAEERTAERLMELVNGAMPFQITIQDATEILTRTANKRYVEGHAYLGTKTVPLVHDFADFYVYGENVRYNLLARALAAQQNVVWGTGTHTSTPVLLAAMGPADAIARFKGILHATDVGQAMIDLLGYGSSNVGPIGTASKPVTKDGSQ